MKTMIPQFSEWSVAYDTVLEYQNSSNKNKANNTDSQKTLTDVIKQNPGNDIPIKSRSVWKQFQRCLSTSCCMGLIIGMLTAGIILAVVTTLWLTSAHQTSTTIRTSTDISSIMNTTTMTSSTLTKTTTKTTSSTSTTATTTTATTTISNICIGGAIYTTQLLYLSLNATLPWTKYSFNYTAPNINSATLIFAMRNDPNFWYLDDVSVTNSLGTQLLSNGGFEQGTFASWTYCNPNQASYSGAVYYGYSHSGSYSYSDGSVNASDYLSQSFVAVPNNTYSVKFWLSAGSNSSSFALVTITS